MNFLNALGIGAEIFLHQPPRRDADLSELIALHMKVCVQQ